MQNPVLERKLVDCRDLADAWKKFQVYFGVSIQSVEAISPEKEQEFLECKSRIAMLHDSFMESLQHDLQIGQNVFSIITRCITLRHVNKMSQAETKKIEIEWHESFLLLNETVTMLEEEIQKLARINPVKYHAARFFDRFLAFLKSFFGSTYFKFTVGALAVLFVAFGVEMFGIYEYDNLRRVEKYGVNKVYYQWMNAKRILVRSTAFGQLSDFLRLYLPSNAAPSGFTYESTNRPEKSKVAGYFAGIVLDDGSNARETLMQLPFEGLRLSRIGRSHENVSLSLFLFHRNSEAHALAFKIKERLEQNPNVELTVFALNNVMVVIESNNKNHRQELASGTFRQPAY